MVSRIVVHIGMHKTGSTSIQEAYFNYKDERLVYPNLGPANQSVPLVTAFHHAPSEMPVHRNLGRTKQQVIETVETTKAEIIAALESGADTILLSGEDLSLADRQCIDNLQTFLNDYCQDITICAYIRDPISYTNSVTVERLKHSADQTTIAKPHYKSRFKKFIDIFGKSSVRLRRYQPLTFANRSVVDDLANWMDLPLPAASGERKNTRLSAEAADVLYQLNTGDWLPRSPLDEMKCRQFVVQTLSHFGHQSYRLASTLVVDDAVRADCDWLEKETGIRFALDKKIDGRTSLFLEPKWEALADFLKQRNLVEDGVKPGPDLFRALLRNCD